MTRIHPNFTNDAATSRNSSSKSVSDAKREVPTVLTVWKKSLLFNCKGYTVYDSKGALRFRVDSYSSRRNATEIVLMDHVGKPLLSFRRKRFCFGRKWLIYNGGESANPIFAVKKQSLFGSNKILANVSKCGAGGEAEEEEEDRYVVEGSYEGRCCCVHDRIKKRVVAEVQRKESMVGGVGFGNDVFRLVVDESEFDSVVAMSVVILLEQMYPGSS